MNKMGNYIIKTIVGIVFLVWTGIIASLSVIPLVVFWMPEGGFGLKKILGAFAVITFFSFFLYGFIKFKFVRGPSDNLGKKKNE